VIAALRVCAPATVAAARAPMDPDLADLVKRKATVAIAGRLRPTYGKCTLMDCGCCNACARSTLKPAVGGGERVVAAGRQRIAVTDDELVEWMREDRVDAPARGGFVAEAGPPNHA
jgi:hypothetical protein